MKTTRVQPFDDLEAFVEEVTRENQEFPRMVDAAATTRALIRGMVRHRVALGLSQADVAERMGVSQPAVARFEKGEIEPKATTLIRYASAVGKRLVTVASRERKGRHAAATS